MRLIFALHVKRLTNDLPPNNISGNGLDLKKKKHQNSKEKWVKTDKNMLTQDFKEGEKQNSSSAENLLLINLSRTQSLGVTPPLDTGEDFHL